MPVNPRLRRIAANCLGAETKQADLLPSVELQPHQKRVVSETQNAEKNTGSSRMLLYHGLGSGKGLSSLAAADAAGRPYTAIMPASLRENFKAEQRKFLDPATSPPGEVISQTAIGTGRKPAHPETLIVDEVQRLRSPHSAATKGVLRAAAQAKQLTLLSGTPVVNSPGDFATQFQMLTGEHVSPEEFENRYVDWRGYQPGFWAKWLLNRKPLPPGLKNRGELASLLKGHIDYHTPPNSPARVDRKDVMVEMSPDQADLYKSMYNRIPETARIALEQHYPVASEDMARMQGFLTGPRQVGLSTNTFSRGNADPLAAFDGSPKLRAAFDSLKATFDKNPAAKALVFSNFVGAGLTPYQKALERAGIPSAMFTGKLDDTQRRQLQEDYNSGKIRAALIAPSGTEGLSFKGTRLEQLLDPHWNMARTRQSIGRGLRFDSHLDLPEDQRQVTIERYLARLPSGMTDKLLRQLRLRPEERVFGADEHLTRMAERKDQVNQQLLDLLKEIGTPTGQKASACLDLAHKQLTAALDARPEHQ